MTAPFERPDFALLPERPRRRHSFFDLSIRTTHVDLAGGMQMSYREQGSGRPLLLIHGLMTSSYSWRYVMEPLAALGFRVIAPDLPGAGQSDNPRGVCSVDLLTQSIAAFQDALDINGCTVIGNSMGGYLAMRLALVQPNQMNRLVNVHSPGVPLARLRALHSAFGVPGVRRLVSAVIARDPERWVYRNVHYFDETLKSREETRAYAEPLRSEAGRRAFLSWMGEALDPRRMQEFVDELAARKARSEAFPVPLMLLYARRDPMVPPHVGVTLGALLEGAPQVWLSDSSHFAHVDTPKLFVHSVREFLQG